MKSTGRGRSSVLLSSAAAAGVAITIAAAVTFGPRAAIEAPRPYPPGVSLFPSAAAVRIGDPLLVKVVLAADDNDSIPLAGRMSSRHGNVRLTLCEPGSDHYRQLVLPGQGVLGCEYTPGGKHIPQGGRVVSYEWLFRDREGYLFSRPGSWRIRATIADSFGRTWTSEECLVVVDGRSEVSWKALLSCRADLARALNSPEPADAGVVARLRAAESDLGVCNAASVIAALTRLEELRVADSEDGRRGALASVLSWRDTLPGPEREYFNLRLAHVYLSRNDAPGATEVMKVIAEDSVDRDLVRAKLGELCRPQPPRIPARAIGRALRDGE